MRIKSWALFENYKEVSYGEFDEFNQTYLNQEVKFSNRELGVIGNFFSSHRNITVEELSNKITFKNKLQLVAGKGGKSLSINKLDDEWYSVAYFNPRFNFSKCWICDQFDELVDCLTMIKNKGWLSTNL